MKKIIAILVLVTVTAVCLTGCGYSVTNGIITEWVSSDGVHYWASEHGMIPRYIDQNGTIMVEGSHYDREEDEE